MNAPIAILMIITLATLENGVAVQNSDASSTRTQHTLTIIVQFKNPRSGSTLLTFSAVLTLETRRVATKRGFDAEPARLA